MVQEKSAQILIHSFTCEIKKMKKSSTFKNIFDHNFHYIMDIDAV